jgi:protein gp37
VNKTKIDWADSTWNPVTGCLHGCTYCYARKIANRFGKMMPDRSGYPQMHGGCHCVDNQFKDNPYPFLFEPTLHAYRLDEPKRKTKGRTIFVCSMADLFGEWVPDEWIQDVFKACEAAPQHRYLFLTKNPKKYVEIHNNYLLCENNNFWYGATITSTDDINPLEEIYNLSLFSNANTFISIEPIQERLSFGFGWLPNWVIVGAETGNRKDKVIPQKEWIDSIAEQCKAANVPVFMKESLRALMGNDFIQEYPWKIKLEV